MQSHLVVCRSCDECRNRRSPAGNRPASSTLRSACRIPMLLMPIRGGLTLARSFCRLHDVRAVGWRPRSPAWLPLSSRVRCPTLPSPRSLSPSFSAALKLSVGSRMPRGPAGSVHERAREQDGENRNGCLYATNSTMMPLGPGLGELGAWPGRSSALFRVPAIVASNASLTLLLSSSLPSTLGQLREDAAALLVGELGSWWRARAPACRSCP